MRTISYKLDDLKKAIIRIGYVGENQHTQVRLDCKDLFREYPDAVPGMTIVSPAGQIYPKVVSVDGSTVVWDVTDSDLAAEGDGEIQLTFTEGGVVAKTAVCRFNVYRSITANGPAPDPIDDWLQEASDALEDIEAAEVNQPMIGQDGFWYTWDQEEGEYVKTGTKAQGEDGDPGTPGHSPVLTADKVGKVTTIYSDGTQLAQISDGQDGQGADVIDDTAPALDKTFSSSKVDVELGQLKNAINGVSSGIEITNAQFTEMNGTIVPPAFEKGVRYVSNGAEIWAATSTRLTFKRGGYIKLKQNDVVSIDTTIINEFAGGYTTDGGTTFVSIDSRNSPYTAPVNGLYFFWLSKTGNVAFTDDDVENGWKLIRFNRAIVEKDLTNVQVLRGATGKNNNNLIKGEIILSGDYSYRNYASVSATSIGFILLNVPGLTEGDDIEFNWDAFINPLADYTTLATFYLNKRNSGGTSIGYAYLTPDNRYVVEANVKSVELVAQVEYSGFPASRWVVAELRGVVVVRGDSLHVNPKYIPNGIKECLKPNYIYSSGNILHRCYNPYKDIGLTAYVGQLHCHAKEKVNGEWIYYGGSVEGLCELHADCGYDFITVTDYVANGEITQKPNNTHGLVWLCDSQETATDADSGLVGQHMCVYNTTKLYNFAKRSQPQDIADIVKEDNCACDLAHPAWSVLYQNPEKVAKIKGKIRFCEVYDGLNDIQGAITVPTGKSTDYAWEIMLDNDCVVWGTAVNDAHTSHDEQGGISKGCVKVYASEKTAEAIWKALCKGNFIACSHVSAGIDSISVTGNRIEIDTGDSGASTVFLKEGGTVLSTQTGSIVSYDMTGNEKYVRAVVTLTSGERVWIQPIVNIKKIALDDYELTF